MRRQKGEREDGLSAAARGHTHAHTHGEMRAVGKVWRRTGMPWRSFRFSFQLKSSTSKVSQAFGGILGGEPPSP